MTIHREGIKTIMIVSIFFVAVNLASFYFISFDYPWLSWCIFLLTILFWLFVLSFFRVPKRKLVTGDQLIVSPADGKVVVIEETVDEEYFKGKRLQISIFMSPANVHQNRNPVSGEVVYTQYHKGKYLVAWHPKSSTENERHTVVIRNAHAEVLVKQIAGAVARRIVNYLKLGQQADQSAEMGFIKFGSRVDLLLPVGTKVEVGLNQVVQGGVTVLARF
ncbi:MAG: phosphatidylserine decarboxylase family protein [Chitinophagaceae bacterium]|nr:phosphatidylserine decarboxylase family protein [Chitinophagaceae bacterium]